MQLNLFVPRPGDTRGAWDLFIVFLNIVMHPPCHVITLDVLLKRCYTASWCQRSPARRAYATATTSARGQNEVKEVAILGGGITGLASAWYLSQELPHAKITLYEGNSRLGGWLHSRQVDVGDSNVVFEQGPRTLRPSVPNGIITLELVGYQSIALDES